MTKPVISQFNQLAEVMIQEYERYLPTAFDDSMSLLEKVNKIIQHMNEIGKINNDVVTQWNTVMEWVMNDGLSESVVSELNTMVADGTFDSIINTTIFNDLNNQIQELTVNVKTIGAIGNGVADDTAKINEALLYCQQNGLKLFFPSGDYKVTGNLLNFKDVITEGIGVIVSGTDRFRITPKTSDTNIIYAGYGGTTTNDGLSESRPVTLASALTFIQSLGNKAQNGQWRLQLVSGLITENGLNFYNLPPFTKPLQIWGKWDGVNRLTTWDGTNSTPVYAIRADGYNGTLHLDIRYIKAINWNKNISNAGFIVAWEGVNLRTEFIEVKDSTIGVWVRGGFSRHYGDVLDNCEWGYGFQYNHSATVGEPNKRVTIKNCFKGIMLGRQSVIHADYTDFSDNDMDMQVHQKSRVATVGSTFARWKDVSIWLQGDSIHEDDGSTWDANSIADLTPIYRFENGSSVPATHVGALPYRISHYAPASPYVLSGTTTETLLSGQLGFGSPLRTPKNQLFTNGNFQFRMRARVDVSGSGGTKKLALTGSGGSGSQLICDIDIPAGGGNGILTVDIDFRANGQGFAVIEYRGSVASLNVIKFVTLGSTLMSVLRDKTSDLALWRFYGTLQNSADSMTLYTLTSEQIN